VSIGPAEIIIVLVIALLVFGPSRLPQMGRSLGRGVREFKKAADTAKNELGLGEVTDGINDIKSTFTEPLQEVTSTFTDLKSSVDVKSAIEAPVGAGATAGAVGAATATTSATAGDTEASAGVTSAAAGEAEVEVEATSAPEEPALSPWPTVVTQPGTPLGVIDEGPETPDVTPETVFADVAPPPAPDAPTAAATPEAPVEEPAATTES
jgi:sec-independent protein translocase protein TatA